MTQQEPSIPDLTDLPIHQEETDLARVEYFFVIKVVNARQEIFFHCHLSYGHSASFKQTHNIHGATSPTTASIPWLFIMLLMNKTSLSHYRCGFQFPRHDWWGNGNLKKANLQQFPDANALLLPMYSFSPEYFCPCISHNSAGSIPGINQLAHRQVRWYVWCTRTSAWEAYGQSEECKAGNPPRNREKMQTPGTTVRALETWSSSHSALQMNDSRTITINVYLLLQVHWKVLVLAYNALLF